MVNITNKNIYMTKSDTVKLTISIKDKAGNEYVMKSGDNLHFTVRDRRTHKNVIEIKQSTNTVVIDTDMTKDLIVDCYEYDVQLIFANGDINTIIPIHKFVIEKEVS